MPLLLHSWLSPLPEPILIGLGPLPTPLPVVSLISSLLDPKLEGRELGNLGGVNEPEESPLDPKPMLKGNRGGVSISLLPFGDPRPFIGSIAQGLRKLCSSIAIETASGMGGIIIIP